MDEDRLKHSLAVARKMEKIAKTLGLSEKEININIGKKYIFMEK